MSEEFTFTPSRLTLARQRRGMTLVQLASQIEITSQSLSNAENGRQRPSEATVQKLARALDFPAEFFGLSDLEELEDSQLSFRARSKTTSRAKSAVKSSARIAIELRCWIDERFITPEVDIPSIDSEMTPELAAEHVRASWGIDSVRPIGNCVELLESKGIAVFSLPSEYRDVDAFSFWRRGRAYIMLSTLKTAERSRFDAAHELGHLVLHQNEEYGTNWRSAELEANKFAGAFLMPRDSVRKYFPGPATTDRIIRSKSRWKVAAMALAYRLHELDLLSEWTYRQVVLELGRLGYRSNEPGGQIRETSYLLAKVFAALRVDRVSLRSVAAELGVNSEELRSITFGLLVRAAGADPGVGSVAAEDESPRLRLVR